MPSTCTCSRETRLSYEAGSNGLNVSQQQTVGLPSGITVTQTYTWDSFDAADRVKTETDAEGNVTSFQYNEAGNVIAVTDPESHTTRFEYDPMNRRTAVIDATGYRTETKYSLRGDIVAVTNANDETMKFEIDALGRKTAAIDPKGYRSEFSYDENGNLVCTLDANAQAGLQPKNAQTPACTETRQYDELNRITRIIDADNGETDPDYTQVDYQYDPAGRLLSRVTANGVRMTQSFDANGWLTRLDQYDAANSLVSSTSYTRDRTGNITQTTDAGGTTTYTLDALYRLTQADYPGTANDELFTYDKADNRKTATKGSLTANAGTLYYNYTAGTNRLLDIRIGSAAGAVGKFRGQV